MYINTSFIYYMSYSVCCQMYSIVFQARLSVTGEQGCRAGRGALQPTATGGWFTLRTVTTTVAVAVPSPSLTVYVKTSVPLKPSAGV